MRILSLLLALSLVACQSTEPDPREGPVELPAAEGFEARCLWSAGVGVWTTGTADVMPWYAGPEVVALDDRGRCVLLVQNSGKTTPLVALEDGTWLGGLAHGDVDPHREGAELYVGAQRGNLYRVVAHAQGGFDAQVIAHFPGREVHSLVALELDGRPGAELVCGLSSGEIVQLAPPDDRGGTWTPWELHEDPGRIRQLLGVSIDGRDRILYASRSGRLVLLASTPAGYTEQVLHEAAQGLARIAAGPTQAGGAPRLYAIGDAGEVLRFERDGGSTWTGEAIHFGPWGGRGIAVGALAAEPDRETLAIFGYSGAVELLERAPDGSWAATEVFRDVDKGHWLALAELDDRNETRELVLAGYSGRVVLLSRPPGFGR